MASCPPRGFSGRKASECRTRARKCGASEQMAVVKQWHKDGHAIVQASFALELTAPASPPTIRELLALHSKLKDEYPRRREMQGRTFGIPAADALPIPQVGEPVLAGFNFDSLRPDGNIQRAISLNERTLTITRGDYDRWHKTWPEVRSIFTLMLPILLERADVVTFHLQYQNRFIWEGDPGAFRADMLFRNGSRFLAPNAFDAPELWHSNHGYFEYPDQPSKHQLLSTSDVQVVLPERVGVDADAGWSLVAEVRLNHRVIHGLERAGGQGKPVGTVEEVLGNADVDGLVDHYMAEMHTRNNWLLARLINDEMCDAIKLPRPE
jgi:uncharacterized protein (TIGR04255 family)